MPEHTRSPRIQGSGLGNSSASSFGSSQSPPTGSYVGSLCWLVSGPLVARWERPRFQHAVPRSRNCLLAPSRERTLGRHERAALTDKYMWRRDLVTLQRAAATSRDRLSASKCDETRAVVAGAAGQKNLRAARTREPSAREHDSCLRSWDQPVARGSLLAHLCPATGCAQRTAASTSSGRSGITRVALGTSGFDGSSRTSTMSESRMRSTRQLIS